MRGEGENEGEQERRAQRAAKLRVVTGEEIERHAVANQVFGSEREQIMGCAPELLGLKVIGGEPPVSE